MYFIPIHVPLYRDGDELFATSEWKRSLTLLRDSLQGRYGPLVVLAPSVPITEGAPEQRLERIEPGDGISVVPGFNLHCRAREYWLTKRRSWCAQLRELITHANVAHTTLDDLYRPIAFEGFLEALRQHKPTVFVQDTDIALRTEEARVGSGASLWLNFRNVAYSRGFEATCRWSVRRASLALLKGKALMDRYAKFAHNAREIQDTSYAVDEIVPATTMEHRLARLRPHTPLRLVYCGRFVERKGLLISLRVISLALEHGAQLTFDLIGDGPQRAELESTVAALHLDGRVRFLGAMQYGRNLIDLLSTYDALLFTPILEDTPRMIFDGYAAGLPLIANDIAYVRERAAEEGATLQLDRRDEQLSASKLVELWRRPERLLSLARAAHAAATYHAAENWYRRRAEWTFQAVSEHRAQNSGSAKLAAR